MKDFLSFVDFLWFCLLQAPSVDLAMQILDGTALRPGGTPIMSVSPAKFEQKGGTFQNLEH